MLLSSPKVLPGPPKYAKQWPFRLFLVVLGYCFTYLGGPGSPIMRDFCIICTLGQLIPATGKKEDKSLDLFETVKISEPLSYTEQL